VITTVTTVTTVTAVTTIVAMGLTAAISIAATVILILSLTTKELAGAGNSSFSTRLSRYLNVSILPLMMAFAVIVAVKIAEALL